MMGFRRGGFATLGCTTPPARMRNGPRKYSTDSALTQTGNSRWDFYHSGRHGDSAPKNRRAVNTKRAAATLRSRKRSRPNTRVQGAPISRFSCRTSSSTGVKENITWKRSFKSTTRTKKPERTVGPVHVCAISGSAFPGGATGPVPILPRRRRRASSAASALRRPHARRRFH